MATRIIVDGYNLMLAGQGLNPDSIPDLEGAREALLHKLSLYRNSTGHKIVVVFDGSYEGIAHPCNLKVAGMEVVFSRPPLKADDVIRKRVRQAGAGQVVVTADRELASAVEKSGCTSISSAEFLQRMEYAELVSRKGGAGEEEYPREPPGTKKKGNPRRLSRKERKRRARLNKL